MNELSIFKFEEKQVRTIMVNEEVYFVAKDVSEILGYSETSAMTKRLDEDEFMSAKLAGMNMLSTIINESGLYNAIIGSNKPEAKKFKKWVTSEVLPSIRKNGGYLAPTVDFTNPDVMINLLNNWKADREKLLLTEQKLEVKEKQIEIIKPKADMYNITMSTDNWFNMNEVAKMINNKRYGRNKLYELLRERSVLQRNNQPYQKFVDSGLFKLVEVIVHFGGTTNVVVKTVVSQKGISAIIKLIKKLELEAETPKPFDNLLDL